MARCRIKAIVFLRTTSFITIVLLLVSCSQSDKKMLEFNCQSEIVLNIRSFRFCDTLYNTSLMGLWETKNISFARDFSDSASFVFVTDSTLSIKGKEAIFAIYKPDTSLCVNSKYFSDLIQVDVTNFSDVHVIGSVKKALSGTVSENKILELLFRTFILRSFTHLDPKICRLSEANYDSSSPEDWNSSVYVTTYKTCSNHCTDHQSAFQIIISEKTGEINVQPVDISDSEVQRFVKNK